MLQFTKSTIVTKEIPIVKIPVDAAKQAKGPNNGYLVEILDHELRECILKSIAETHKNGNTAVVCFWMKMRCLTLGNNLYLNNCKYSKIDENTALLSRVDSVVVDARFETVEEQLA